MRNTRVGLVVLGTKVNILWILEVGNINFLK
jgi:hypothetical protein